MATTKRAKQLRGLASILAASPDINYLELADRAGLSRRTLYRIAASRDDLIEILTAAALDATAGALARADLTVAEPVVALSAVTRDFVADADLYAFWVMMARSVAPGHAMNAAILSYRETMSAFFERAQRSGALRSDLPTSWMTSAYDALLIASAETTQHDPSPTIEQRASAVVDMFLDGIRAR